MSATYLLLAFTALVSICIQDFRLRAVSWFLFPLGLVALVLWRSTSLSWQEIFQAQLLNLGFLLFHMALLFVVFKIKGISSSIVFKTYLGFGDVLFFLLLALGLPSDAFFIFFLASLVISLIIGLTFYRNGTIPLAGLQAGLLSILLMFHATGVINIYALNLLSL